MDIHTREEYSIGFNDKRAALQFYTAQVAFDINGGEIFGKVGIRDNKKNKYLKLHNYT